MRLIATRDQKKSQFETNILFIPRSKLHIAKLKRDFVFFEKLCVLNILKTVYLSE